MFQTFESGVDNMKDAKPQTIDSNGLKSVIKRAISIARRCGRHFAKLCRQALSDCLNCMDEHNRSPGNTSNGWKHRSRDKSRLFHNAKRRGEERGVVTPQACPSVCLSVCQSVDPPRRGGGGSGRSSLPRRPFHGKQYRNKRVQVLP